jgi:pimeloyl-ACP methyl ester carboxylesterase
MLHRIQHLASCIELLTMTYARINKVDLYYEVQGFGDPVLLIHGLGSDLGTWAQMIPGFTGSYRLILFENRGAGRSSKPSGPYSTELMAEDAVALMDHLGIQRAHVIGKSMGGMIAQWIAVRYPEKVRSLVLASTVMKHDAYGEELLELGRDMAEKAGLFATYRQAFLMSYTREYCMTNRSRLEEVKALLDRLNPEEFLQGYREQSVACQKHDTSHMASKIKSPTLVIVGKDDLITPVQASRNLAAAIPKAELVVVQRGGHGFWREFAGEVNGVVRDFIDCH